MKQSEFNDFVADEIIKLRDENKALKQQLGAVNSELLEDLKTTMDSAQAMHAVIKTERASMSEKNLQDRKAREEMDKEYRARHEVTMEALRKQVMAVYDSNAETQSAVEQMRNLRDEVSGMGGTLIERQDNIVKNIDDRFNNFDRMAGNEYLAELHRNDVNKRSNAEISNEIQRQMRLMNPTAFAEPEEQTEG